MPGTQFAARLDAVKQAVLPELAHFHGVFEHLFPPANVRALDAAGDGNDLQIQLN